LQWASALSVDSKLAYVMEVTPQSGVKDKRVKRTAGKLPAPEAEDDGAHHVLWKRPVAPQQPRPLHEKGPVDFAIGGQSWDTTSDACSVGGWDNGDANDFFGSLVFGDSFTPNRQMDCKFDC